MSNEHYIASSVFCINLWNKHIIRPYLSCIRRRSRCCVPAWARWRSAVPKLQINNSRSINVKSVKNRCLDIQYHRRSFRAAGFGFGAPCDATQRSTLVHRWIGEEHSPFKRNESTDEMLEVHRGHASCPKMLKEMFFFLLEALFTPELSVRKNLSLMMWSGTDVYFHTKCSTFRLLFRFPDDAEP